jgi:hypothetical protein
MTPLTDPMVATVVVLLIQVPPLTEFVNIADAPWQILDGPEIAAGTGLIVTVFTAVQPVGRV